VAAAGKIASMKSTAADVDEEQAVAPVVIDRALGDSAAQVERASNVKSKDMSCTLL
jgi:hypothetical protein